VTNVSRCPHLPLCRTQRAYVGGRASEAENNRDRDDTSPSIRRGLDHATLHRGGYRTATWSAPHGRRGSIRLQSTRQRSPRCPNTAGQPNTACLASTTGHGLPPWRVLAQLGSVSSTPPDCCHGVRVRGSCPTQAALGAPPIGCLVIGDGTPRRGVEGATRALVGRWTETRRGSCAGHLASNEGAGWLWLERAEGGLGCRVSARWGQAHNSLCGEWRNMKVCILEKYFHLIRKARLLQKAGVSRQTGERTV